jgi:hypothetical protein
MTRTMELTLRMLKGERPAELDQINDLDVEQALIDLRRAGLAKWDDAIGEVVPA